MIYKHFSSACSSVKLSFANLILCQLVISSTCHFVNLPFSKFGKSIKISKMPMIKNQFLMSIFPRLLSLLSPIATLWINVTKTWRHNFAVLQKYNTKTTTYLNISASQLDLIETSHHQNILTSKVCITTTLQHH